MSEGIDAVTRVAFRAAQYTTSPGERAPPRVPGGDQPMLLPAKNEVARQLRRYRRWERAMLASPADRAARDHFEDSGYTLCVLMGKRCAREAVTAAERYLRTPLPTYLQEQTGQTRQTGDVGRGPQPGPVFRGRAVGR